MTAGAAAIGSVSHGSYYEPNERDPETTIA